MSFIKQRNPKSVLRQTTISRTRKTTNTKEKLTMGRKQ